VATATAAAEVVTSLGPLGAGLAAIVAMSAAAAMAAMVVMQCGWLLAVGFGWLTAVVKVWMALLFAGPTLVEAGHRPQQGWDGGCWMVAASYVWASWAQPACSLAQDWMCSACLATCSVLTSRCSTSAARSAGTCYRGCAVMSVGHALCRSKPVFWWQLPQSGVCDIA
jgi:hypothetical protein